MNSFDMGLVREFVNQNMGSFHQGRIRSIQNLHLRDILKRKNPYLFKAKNIHKAAELVASIMDAFLSSSEEGLFGGFLESLAIFVNQMVFNGQKSSAPGIDLEFNRDNTRYLVAIKSGSHWGNSSQHKTLGDNFKNAVKILRQSQHIAHVRPVLGICYGKSRTTDTGAYLKICGQSFWEFISGNPDLYIDLVEAVGHEANMHQEFFLREKESAFNRLVQQFTLEFCDDAGDIDWEKLVRFNSGNLQ